MRNNEYWGMTKLVEGISNIKYSFECYIDSRTYGYDYFWETLNVGWYEMEIYPYDDWYDSTISKQRQTLLAQKRPPIKIQLMVDVSGAYIAYTDRGFTICAQPDRKKAEECLEYYKKRFPDVKTIYGTWDQ